MGTSNTKVLLVSPLFQPSLWENEIASREPHLGLLYIASVLLDHGHPVEHLERRRIIGTKRRTRENLKELDRETVKRIESFSPDFVGITATTPLIMDAYRVTRLIKEVNPETKIMLGGCHPTAEPARTLLDCPEIDLVCCGEGEFTFLDFVHNLPFNKIKGVAYRENGKVTLTEPRDFYQDLDDLPFPARHLLDRGYYFSPQSMTMRGYYLRQTTIIAARGCPYKCTFCQSGHLAKAGKGRFVRFRSPEGVIEELKHLVKDFGINGFLFAEDVFSIKKDNLFKICELMIREGLHKELKWAANLRVDLADKEIFEIMRRAGCIQIVYGCESGSQKTLARLQKKTTVEKNCRAIRLAKEAGITVEANMMIGLPDETEDDFKATIDFLRRARPDRINRGKLYPLPGTPIYEELKRTNQLEEVQDWNDLWDRYVATPFTFTKIGEKKFARLQARMDRGVTYPINYLYTIKNNWRVYPALAIRQMILMVAHCAALYLPLKLQKTVRKIADLLQIQSKYVAE